MSPARRHGRRPPFQRPATYCFLNQRIRTLYRDYCNACGTITQLDRILEAERGALIAVRKHLAVARQTDDGAQGLFGIVLAHEVLELIDEAALAGNVRGTLIQYAADVSGERHVGQQVAREDALAFIESGVRKGEPGVGELDIAALDLREAHQLQRLSDRKQ